VIRVASHPRSGTNLLCKYLKEVFYPDVNLSVSSGTAGHWQARSVVPGNEYGKLFLSHQFFGKGVEGVTYMYRDGRDVMVSLFNTKEFLPEYLRSAPFSTFLKSDIQFHGSPGTKSVRSLSPVKHWHDHLVSWEGNWKACVRYSDIVNSPMEVMEEIAQAYDISLVGGIETISHRVGMFPGKGFPGIWEQYFSKDDAEYFYSIVPKDFWGLRDV